MLFNSNIYQPQDVEVRESPLHGRGVFARNKIMRGSLIERAPVIFLSDEEKDTLRHTRLYHYYFLLGNPQKQTAFGFGYASFYNHSAEANAFYTFSLRKKTINIYAYRTIEPGQEVTINYNGKPEDKRVVYFPNSDSNEE